MAEDRPGSPARLSYAASGVDVAAGDRAVELMRDAVESTRRPEVLGSIGGFGGAITIPPGYREPVIVSSTDGVGTKTAIAVGASALGHDRDRPRRDVRRRRRLQRRRAARVPRLRGRRPPGARCGCRPGRRRRRRLPRGGLRARRRRDGRAPRPHGAGHVRPRRDVPRDRGARRAARRLGRRRPATSSSACRPRGSTPTASRSIRSLLAEFSIPLERPYQEQLAMTLGDGGRDAALAAEPELALQSVGDVLLAPTRIYARRILDARRALRAAGHDLRGVAHITGGGLPGNAPRAVPDGARRPPRPDALDDAFGDVAHRRARRPRGDGDPRDVQRRPRDGLVVAPTAAEALHAPCPRQRSSARSRRRRARRALCRRRALRRGA